jgi:hypothetical protein
MKNSTFTFSSENELSNTLPKNKVLLEQPSQKSIDFILNYSRSLEVKKSRMIDEIYLHLN